MAAPLAQHAIGLPTHRKAGIRGSQQKPHLMADCQIVEVVADKGRACRCHTQLALQLLEGGGFVFDAHQTMLDPQLCRTHFCCSTFAAAEERQLQASLLE